MRISDWSSDVCSSDLNCGEQREWIGFSNRQCVATDNSVEHTSPAERFDQMVRKSLRLIGANREPEALDPQLFEREFRSEEHTSELQSLMRISYAVFCLKTKRISTYLYDKH